MTFRNRLLVTALVTLGVGLGGLLVVANVLLQVGMERSTSNLLRERASAQIAALDITPRGLHVRESPNDKQLDRDAWVFEGRRVIERPAAAGSALNRAAIALAGSRRSKQQDAAGDMRLRVSPVLAPGRRRVGAVVVGT